MNELLKDICSRIPYGLKVCVPHISINSVFNLIGVQAVDKELTTAILTRNNGIIHVPINLVKPCLFPLLNMTEKQKEDLLLTVVGKEGLKLFSVTKDGIISNDKEEQPIESFCFNNINFSNETTEAYIDWFNKNHFDYRGLIERGLAIKAPEGMYN